MIQVIGRAFGVLELLAERPRGLGELAAATGLHKPTLHNILGSLEQVGAVCRVAGRRYALGPKLAELTGRGGWDELIREGRQVVQRLVGELNESANVSVLDRGKRRMLVHAAGDRDLIVGPRFGHTGSLYKAATGRVLIAHLSPEQRRRLIDEHGWPEAQWDRIASVAELESAAATIREAALAIHEGATLSAAMVAAPVFAPGGAVIAALGVGVPSVRFTGAYRQRVIEAVRDAAAELTDRLVHAAPDASAAMAAPEPVGASASGD